MLLWNILISVVEIGRKPLLEPIWTQVQSLSMALQEGLFSFFLSFSTSVYVQNTYRVSLRWVEVRPRHDPHSWEMCVCSFTSLANQYREDAQGAAYCLQSLSENTRMSNHLRISQWRLHILLSYFRDPEWCRVWGLNLLHGSPAICNMS